MYIKDIQVDILKDFCRITPKHKVFYEKPSNNETFLCVDGYVFYSFPSDLLFLDTEKMQKLDGIISKNIQDVQNDEETVVFKGESVTMKNGDRHSKELYVLHHADSDTKTYIDKSLCKYLNINYPGMRLSTKRNSTISVVLFYERGQVIGGVLPCRFIG